MLPEKAEIEAKIKELQTIMRIQDWDIELEYCTALEMQKETDNERDLGYCRRNRKRMYAQIVINKEHPEAQKDWYGVLIHEMYHIVTDDFQYHVACLLDKMEGEDKETWTNVLDIYYERLVDNLTRGFVNASKLGNTSTVD